jgi:hypothetical protein
MLGVVKQRPANDAKGFMRQEHDDNYGMGKGRKCEFIKVLIGVCSSVNIVSDYILDERGLIPGRSKGFFL